MNKNPKKFYSPPNKNNYFFKSSGSGKSIQSCNENITFLTRNADEYQNENDVNLNVLNNLTVERVNNPLKRFPRSKEIETLFKKRKNEIKKLSHYRKIVNRQSRKNLLEDNIHLKQISNCNSRVTLSKIFQRINKKLKNLLEKYVKDWMIFHLHIRQIKQFDQLMRHRQILFESIEDPSLLVDGPVFENNLIKNFCKGFVHFVAMYKDELIINNLL